MIDQVTFELLSRHLDDDLEPAERQLLDARLAAEPALAAELAGLGRLRDRLRDLAALDEPPADLDAALEPLRRSVPPAVGLRPAFRWLALAATLFIGATVTLHVARRTPPPAAPAPTRAAKGGNNAPYQLHPLPTSAVPEDQQLLGAAERLLASPLPTPVWPEPPVHVAVGPLTESEHAAAAPAEPLPAPRRRDALSRPTRAQPQARAEELPAPAPHPGSVVEDKDAGVTSKMAAPRQLSEGLATRGPVPAATAQLEGRAQAVASRQGTVTLRTGRGPVVVPFATHLVDGALERLVSVSVRAGVITAVRVPATDEALALPAGLAGELAGLPVGAMADGEYEAAIRVD